MEVFLAATETMTRRPALVEAVQTLFEVDVYLFAT